MRVERGRRSARPEEDASLATVPTRPQGLFKPRYWPTLMALGLGALCARMPYRVLMATGTLLGALEYHLLFLRRRRADRHIKLCFPQHTSEGRRRLLRANFTAYGVGIMERLIGWWWPRQRLARLLNRVDGLEHLQRVRCEGRGVLLLVTHGTSMELVGALLRTLHPVDGSYLPARNRLYDWVQLRARHAGDPRSSPVDAGNVREMVRRLRKGRVVWYAPDRFYPGKPCVMAPLFGHAAATITATSKYARLGDAAVMTLDFWRDPGGGYSLRIGAPWADFPSKDLARDCRRINRWIEDVVVRHPEQYRWIHKRFKRPADDLLPRADRLETGIDSVAAPANEGGDESRDRIAGVRRR